MRGKIGLKVRMGLYVALCLLIHNDISKTNRSCLLFVNPGQMVWILSRAHSFAICEIERQQLYKASKG